MDFNVLQELLQDPDMNMVEQSNGGAMQTEETVELQRRYFTREKYCKSIQLKYDQGCCSPHSSGAVQSLCNLQ